MAFQILCRVSGGVTGTREAILKEGEGENRRERYFDSREEAQALATKYNKEMNHSYSTADFRYTVVEA